MSSMTEVKTEPDVSEVFLPRIDESEAATGEVIRLSMADGNQQFFALPPGEKMTDDTVFVDSEGLVIDKSLIVTETFSNAMGREHSNSPPPLDPVEDNTPVRCGLCSEVIDTNQATEHFLREHPEHISDQSTIEFEKVSHDEWLQEEHVFPFNHKLAEAAAKNHVYVRSTRKLRRVSQVRVNPEEMTMQQLESALKRKMVEKMGRPVPVSLVDKKHARCDICNAIISLNKKFEIVHLVRHFQAWHPSNHRCTGTWSRKQENITGNVKFLSLIDFAVIDTDPEAEECLQCIYCGMLMNKNMLAMHFHEVHPDEIIVPDCHLCLSELVANARVLMKFGEPFDITMPDEYHFAIGRFSALAIFKTEKKMDAAISIYLRKVQNGEYVDRIEPEDTDVGAPREHVLNSRANFGRRNKPKRHFVMPKLRQAIPKNSSFVEHVEDCHWLCVLCKSNIIGAVTSAAAIRHYRQFHPEVVENLQEELCKARLERVSDGCMQLLTSDSVYCDICTERYSLHRPFNMCRAVRHLKTKHPSRMPEHQVAPETEELDENESLIEMEIDVTSSEAQQSDAHMNTSVSAKTEDMAMQQLLSGGSEEVTDAGLLSMLRSVYDLTFERVHAVRGSDGEMVYILVDDTDDVSGVPEKEGKD